MKIYIVGICGTFMASVAVLAKSLGHEVVGVDQQVYPPMSTMLEEQGIRLIEGYENHDLDNIDPDQIIVGNAISRGNPALEYLLDHRQEFYSGPSWLARYVLNRKKVLAVSGTHGKTTTASMLAWMLNCIGEDVGFLVGGVLQNFGVSARLGQSDYFVIEADEYDTAFNDKRSKFVHYRPYGLIINNLEFDHADIFDNLDSIKKQFHHVVRTVPSNGVIVANDDDNIRDVFAMGAWTPTVFIGKSDASWSISRRLAGKLGFTINDSEKQGKDKSVDVSWDLSGDHNIDNALIALKLLKALGEDWPTAAVGLAKFRSAKRRQELIANIAVGQKNIRIFDDFAHHPTAIKTTLSGLRQAYKPKRLVAVVEPRSNTMKRGVHHEVLMDALVDADRVWWLGDDKDQAQLPMGFAEANHIQVRPDVESLSRDVIDDSDLGDVIVVMSNGGFGGIHQLLIDGVSHRFG